jgi:uncharacterized membrane protein YdjX (TVP38/TMEM64 family)
VSWRRGVVLLLLAGAIAAFLVLGLDEYLDVPAIKRERFELLARWHRTPLPTAAMFFALNVAALALSLPGAVLGFALAAGAIFGPWWGTAIALGAVVAGDSLAFLLARFVIRDWVEQRFPRQARGANAGVERDGAFYLLSLRLLAVMPYFLVNWTMGLTRMKLRLFAPVSFAGLLPVTFLYVQAGSQLGELEQASDIYSPAMLTIFALLALLPLAARFALRRRQGVRGQSAT